MERVAACFLSLLIAAGCGKVSDDLTTSPVDTSDSKPITLRLTAKVGDAYRYMVSIKMEVLGTGDRAQWTMYYDEKAVSVAPDSSTWRVRFYGMQVEEGGIFSRLKEELAEKDGLEMNLRFSTLGHSLDGEGASAATGDLVFPEQPIRPEDRWEGEVDVGDEVADITCTFVKRLAYNGKRAVLIEGILPGGQKAKNRKPTQLVVDPRCGKVWWATSDYEILRPKRMHVSSEMTRILE